MPRNSLKLKIAYLYPDILQGFCDKANVEAFKLRCLWRDIDVQINEINANEKFQPSKYDFYYIGGSNIENIHTANNYINQNKESLQIATISEVPMLCVNCGYMLFSNFYQLHNNMQIKGLEILNVDSIAGKNHHFGEIVGTCSFLKNKSIVGFENHTILSYLKANTIPFLTLKKGLGNNYKTKTEGARFNNVIGTYLTSPILAQNPHLCDFFISTALRIKYRCRIPLTPLCDDLELYSHNYILENK